MTRPPIIGVTATSEVPSGHGRRVRVHAAYVEALEGAGALPLVVPPLTAAAGAEALLGAMDGLVLTGGEDVEPVLYGARPHAALGRTNRERDDTELALVEGARAASVPTLAICRGIQLLNVALGGTLIQDIASERPDSLDHDAASPRNARVHDVEVEGASRLGDALGVPRLSVNSFHHQAIDRLAPGLRATAHAPDGIIEGAEWIEDAWWAVAVQWHPEELVRTVEPWDRALFSAFTAAARARRDRLRHEER